MNKFMLFLTLVLLMSCKVQPPNSQPNAQQVNAEVTIRQYPIGKDGKWGYAQEGGFINIDYQFEAAEFFIGNTAPIKLKGKYGFINQQGEIIIKPKYDTILYHSKFYSFVIKNGKTFPIDTNGKKIKQDIGPSMAGCIPPLHCSEIDSFFVKIDDQFQLRNKEFEKQRRFDPAANYSMDDFTFDNVMQFSDKSFIVKKNDLYGTYIHFNSVGLHPEWYEEIIPNFMQQHRTTLQSKHAAQGAKVKKNERWGMISTLGHAHFQPEFLSLDIIKGVLYLVEYKEDHWGFIASNKRYF